MAILDEDSPFGAPPRKPPTHHEIGQPVEALSIDELGERIEMLRNEMARLEEVRKAKQASKVAADAFFKA
ncbi:MAG: DUF1192 domain-containing protein [Methylobacteriaceae bacterium]|nr:DUF1192 domain-containing protein [Methylobacteriaceae bacterium]MBV9218688.1 DUF1192 domain-containing protein [Methylobacteriaceae bacterium]MBV9243767.1 DUF1192 domain-containing protein [Methylobacteriaceae bacterium]